MSDSKEEKYLGDQICSSGKLASTIAKRRAKGYGIISDILLILDQIYDSERRIKVGLELRQAWFVNAMLVNVEVWHNVLKKYIKVVPELN